MSIAAVPDAGTGKTGMDATDKGDFDQNLRPTLLDRARHAFLGTVRFLGCLATGAVVLISGALPILIIMALLWLVLRPERWLRRRGR